MTKSIKMLAAIIITVVDQMLFAYNGGYENSLLSNMVIGGVTYEGYGNKDLSTRRKTGYEYDTGTTIRRGAYAQCSALKTVDLTGVTSIGDAAFAYSALTSVELPATLKSIGYISFGGCKNLASVTINSTSFITSTDEAKDPFRDCSALKTVTAKCAPPSWDFKKVFPAVTSVKVSKANISAWQAKKYSGVTIALSESTYTVRFHTAYGKDVTRDQIFTAGVAQQLYWKDSQLKWTRDGYTFLGWAKDAASGLVKWANGEKVTDLAAAGKTIDLYAVWYDAKTDYVVRLHRNASGTDVTVAQQRLKVGASISLAWKDSSLGWTTAPMSKVFIGWGTTANATVAKWANGEKVKDLAAGGKTVDLYAVWRPSNAYVVTFHRNLPGGDAVTASQWISRGSSTSLVWKDSGLGWTPAGYAFAGWAESASGTKKYDNGAKVTDLAAAGATKHLYAQWKANVYTVRFHYNYGTDKTTDQVFIYDTEQSLKWLDSGLKWAHPVGAAFLGWAESASGAKKYDNGQKVKNLTAANGGVVHLYAKWNLITVRFHKNAGGTDVTAMQVFKPGVAQNLMWKDSGLKWATPSGRIFVGWGKAANAAVAIYANGEKVKDPAAAGSTLELYAIWAAADSCIVKFYRNYTSADATVAYQGVLRTGGSLAWKDSQIGWANPSGRTFLGWSKTRTAITATYVNGSKVTGLGAKGATVMLFAVWSGGTAKSVSTPQATSQSQAVLSTVSRTDATMKTVPEIFEPSHYRGIFADGSGIFDLLLNEDDSVFFAAWTEDGFWSAECEVEVVGDALLLMFEADEPIVIRVENSRMIAEGVDE